MNFIPFKTSAGVIQELLKERECTSYRGYQTGRFPIRYILMDDIMHWIELVENLKKIVDRIIFISIFCEDEDKYPELNKVIKEVKNSLERGESVLLLPLGELIRFHPKYLSCKTIIGRFQNIQMSPKNKGRVYIPLFGITSKIINFWEYTLDKERRYSPIYIEPSVSSTKKLRIFISEDKNLVESVNDPTLIKLSGFREYLSFWETLGRDYLLKDIMVSSKVLFNFYHISRDVGDLIIDIISNPKELIEKTLNLPVPIPYSKEENKYWGRLAREVQRYLQQNTSGDFASFIHWIFNVKEFSPEIFTKWKDSEDFEKWLLFKYVKNCILEDVESKYLKHVLSKANSYFEFEDEVWMAVFDIIDSFGVEDIYERIRLIKTISSVPPEQFFEKLNELNSTYEKLKVLTGITNREKIEIIKAVSQYLKDMGTSGIAQTQFLDILRAVYPELYYYLQSTSFDEDTEEVRFVERYIQNYKQSKLTNEPNQHLMESVEEFSSKKMLWKFKNRNSIILEQYKDYQLIWIDALGLEWVNFVEHLIRKYVKNVRIIKKIGRANLPTVTEYNDPPSENIEVIKRLDKIVHSYIYPENIIEGLECINNIILELAYKMNKKTVITSDHGTTMFSGRDNQKIKVQYKGEIKRNGRYIELKESNIEEITENPDYYSTQCENTTLCLVSKNYKIFAGGKRTQTEVHGGATLEEALVPIIIIEPTKSVEKKEITPILLTKELSYFKPVLKINISGKLEEEDVILILKHEKIKGKRINETIWEFDLESLNLKPGKYTGILKCGGIEFKLPFKIKSGLEEEELI